MKATYNFNDDEQFWYTTAPQGELLPDPEASLEPTSRVPDPAVRGDPADARLLVPARGAHLGKLLWTMVVSEASLQSNQASVAVSD